MGGSWGVWLTEKVAGVALPQWGFPNSQAKAPAMNEATLISLLQTTQEALQKQQELQELQLQQAQEIQRLHSHLAAVRYLGYALAATHPEPGALAEKYLSLMDYAADTLPILGRSFFRAT